MKKLKQIITVIAFAMVMLSSFESIAQTITITYEASGKSFCRKSGSGCKVTGTITLKKEKSFNSNIPVLKGTELALIKFDKWDDNNPFIDETINFDRKKMKSKYSVKIPAQKMVYSKKDHGFYAIIYLE